METVLRKARARALALADGTVRRGEFAEEDAVTLGDGSFCVGVFRVEEENCAIKVTNAFEDAVLEHDLLSKLSHPNVVRCIGYPVFDVTTPFFRLELVDGRDLLELLNKSTPEKRDPLSEAGLRHILLCVGQALKYLHSHGVAHRDLKPENVLLNARSCAEITEKSTVKLCDFNLSSKIDDPVDHYGGSVVCISPEVMNRGKRLDGKVDVFGFGTLTYAVVTRYAPFVPADLGEGYSEAWLKLLGRVERDARFASRPALRKLTLKCLRWSPQSRPSAEKLVKSAYFLRSSPGLRKARSANSAQKS